MTGPQTTLVPTICPNCGHRFPAVNPDRSTHFVCPSCRSYFVDAWDEPKTVLGSFEKQARLRPFLAPGLKGTIFAKRYEVAGCMFKSEQNDSSARWMEYLLYGEGDSGAVLVEFDGTWLLVRPADETPQRTNGDKFRYKRGTYVPYHNYSVDFINAAGCFDWNILDDQKLLVWEYENGTHRLIYEAEDGKEGSWYYGLPLDAAMVADAFKIPADSLPGMSRTVAAKAADNPYTAQLTWIYRIAFIAVGLVALLQLGINYFHPSSELLNTSFTANTDSLTTAGERPIGTSGFHVQSKSALLVALEAPLANNWLEVNAVLVNDRTGKVFESAKSLEQYSGVEDGESWTESDNSKEIVFSSVPPGDYHLNITTSGDPANHVPNLPVTVRVTHQNWLVSNFILILLVIVAFPVIGNMLSNRYDRNH